MRRAAIGNPWIFSEIALSLGSGTYVAPTATDWTRTIERHLRGLYASMSWENNQRNRPRPYPERAACHRFRGHLAKYLRRARCPVRDRRVILEQEEMKPLLRIVTEALQCSDSGEEADAVS